MRGRCAGLSIDASSDSSPSVQGGSGLDAELPVDSPGEGAVDGFDVLADASDAIGTEDAVGTHDAGCTGNALAGGVVPAGVSLPSTCTATFENTAALCVATPTWSGRGSSAIVFEPSGSAAFLEHGIL